MLTTPRRARPPLPSGLRRLLCFADLVWGHDSPSLGHQIPDENHAVIGARGEEAAPVGTPFNRVDRGGMAAEFEEGLARLSDVKDSDGG